MWEYHLFNYIARLATFSGEIGHSILPVAIVSRGSTSRWQLRAAMTANMSVCAMKSETVCIGRGDYGGN